MNKTLDLRKIIHIDMDAFFASVEQRDNPSLKGKPIVVGGSPNSRGVVSTCSYEARKFGIHSAMASSKAFKLCPKAIFVKPDFSKYKTASDQIRNIFKEYSDLVEPLSIDEAFLDVTQNKKNGVSATRLAEQILLQIYATTQLTASAGVSYNKFLAKVASDMNKPNGITVIHPSKAISFIENLPIRKFFGIGKVTEKKMHQIGILNGLDLKRYNKIQLISMFGKAGEYYYNISRGIDLRPVNSTRIRKSVGKEITLQYDTSDIVQIQNILQTLTKQVSEILNKLKLTGKTVTLKIKYHDFKMITRSTTSSAFIFRLENEIMEYISQLLNKVQIKDNKIRLLGVSVSNLDNELTELVQPYLPFNDLVI